MAVSEWLLTAAERSNSETRIDERHPHGTAWSEGNSLRPLVHGKTYFAELYERVCELGPGDRLYFADWRGDPHQQLTDDPGSTVSRVFSDAAQRGVDVRGLLWRSHWHRLGFSSRGHRFLGEEIGEAGGECLRDMRVRFRGSHHQKFVVLRHADEPGRDIAYVGGIDLCRSRRDDERHRGDEQPLPMAPAYGPRPAWHDVQVAISGPAVHDVETTFRERWEDSTPLTLNPGRLLSSLLQSEQLVPGPLGEQWPPPPSTGGHDVVQILRTFPELLPVGYDFAPAGERSVMLGNLKAITQADRLVYVEDQYLWSPEVGEHFASALRRNPELRLVVVLPLVPDEAGPVAEPPQLYGRSLAMAPILEAGGDRVAVFGLTNEQGLPVYVHAKACVIDHRWASVGSDNLNRRSWTCDSEIACTTVDDRGDVDGPAPEDAFARVLLRTLVAEHLGCAPAEVPQDPVELFEAMVSCAEALDEWYAGGDDLRHGVRRMLSRRPHLPGRSRRRARAARRAGRVSTASQGGERPPGRLRRLAVPELTAAQLRWAPAVYDRIFDPEGWMNDVGPADPGAGRASSGR